MHLIRWLSPGCFARGFVEPILRTCGFIVKLFPILLFRSTSCHCIRRRCGGCLFDFALCCCSHRSSCVHFDMLPTMGTSGTFGVYLFVTSDAIFILALTATPDCSACFAFTAETTGLLCFLQQWKIFLKFLASNYTTCQGLNLCTSHGLLVEKLLISR